MVDMFQNILSSLKIYRIQVRQNWLIGLAWEGTILLNLGLLVSAQTF